MIIATSTVMFAGILVATTLLFGLLTSVMGRLANAHEEFRLRAPVRYMAGSALVLLMFLLTDIMLHEMGGYNEATPAHLLALYLAAGIPVLIGWQLDPAAPVEQWPGMGPKRVRNKALALIEDGMSFGALAKDASDSLRETLPAMMLILQMLHEMRTDDDAHELTVHELRRLVMAQLKEQDSKKATP